MNEIAASFGILLTILQASDFHRGLSGLFGKASCMMNAEVNTFTGVLENGYRSYGLERIAQLHLSSSLPYEYSLDGKGEL